MQPTPSDLYDQLLAFPMDEGDPDLSFEARLARENGWTVRHSRRVLLEYKRFLFLAMTAGHSVTPSEDVDQAWHLHLTYSRSYWERLCRDLLGRPIHHGPTRGGADESAKYRSQYEQTLVSYRTAFAADAPADIWPSSARRFGDDLRVVRVNTARNWVIPKTGMLRAVTLVSVSLFAVVFASGCGGALDNPFDLVGLRFLLVLLTALLIAVLTGRFLRSSVRGPGPVAGDEQIELNWAEAAFLAGGAERIGVAATARMIAAGNIRVSEDGKTLEQAVEGGSPHGLSLVEREIWQTLPLSRDERRERKSLAGRVETVSGDMIEQMLAAGYVISPARQFAAGLLALLPILVVLLFLALPRLVIGLSNGKPVGLLVVVIILAGIAGLLSAILPNNHLSRRGRAILRRHTTNRDSVTATATPESTAMLVGLCGAAVLNGSEIPSLAAFGGWHPKSASSSDGGGGCGGGGCGGGCGGCGGCGG